MSPGCLLFHNCLYFTVNSLARSITRIAEEEFGVTGLSPSYAFLLMLANQNPGILQKDLAESLDLAPSTVTRFIDKLVRQGLLERRVEGRTSKIYPTGQGRQLQEKIDAAWQSLYGRYQTLLGQEHTRALTQLVDEACQKLGT